MTGSDRQRQKAAEAARAVVSPGLWVYLLRLLNFFYQGHVVGRRRCQLGPGVRLSPTATFRNAERIRIGARTHIGERCSLWAGDSAGEIVLGADVLFGPGVYVTASNYAVEPGVPIMQQDKLEASVRIGDDVWLGANVTVLPGVEIGAGSIVGAGAVVTKSLPEGCIAVGVPARVVGSRG